MPTGSRPADAASSTPGASTIVVKTSTSWPPSATTTAVPRWEQVRVHEPVDGWVEVWLRPVDPLDPRPPIRIGVWPEKDEADEVADARAVVEEHDLGAWTSQTHSRRGLD